MEQQQRNAALKVEEVPAHELQLAISGDWVLQGVLPPLDPVGHALRQGSVRSLRFEVSQLGRWDSGLLSFVIKCHALCQAHKVEFQKDTLPPGVRQLIALSHAVPEKKDAQRSDQSAPLLARVGQLGLDRWQGGQEVLSFVGENVLALLRLFRGKAQFRWSDVWVVVQECGPEALGIVALINFLIGLILAFVGAVQLSMFGASIYVADLVAIGTIREMGCIMTGIIVCGRTGAAFAAQLGTMKVNEEIDAFKTFGISPIDFLVLPRMLALILMMPLLCVFADLIAIAGGFTVSIAMLDVTATEYINRTIEAITLKSFLLGVGKGGFFGILVALTGCLRGIQCGTNAAAVGQATTSAVVAGITSIIAADGIFAVLCNALKI